jgi:hypothetical protein
MEARKMYAKGSDSPKQPARCTGSPVRRLLDTNGARPWVWAAIGLVSLWLVMVLHLPM